MSGHCPKCGVYAEEDDERLCASCQTRAENAAFRRNEDSVFAMAQEAGYSTPHGESDSITEAVAWMIAELTRLREIEADAKEANLIGPDGKIRKLCADVRHPLPLLGDGLLYVNASHVWYSVDGHPVGEVCVEDVKVVLTSSGWVFAFEDFDLPLSNCYSTPEAAEAARKEKK